MITRLCLFLPRTIAVSNPRSVLPLLGGIITLGVFCVMTSAVAVEAPSTPDVSTAALEQLRAANIARAELTREETTWKIKRDRLQAACANMKPLVGQLPTAEALNDETPMLSASRADADGGEVAQGQASLDAVPEAGRGRALRLQAACLAIQARRSRPIAPSNALSQTGTHGGRARHLGDAFGKTSGRPTGQRCRRNSNDEERRESALVHTASAS